MFAAHHKLDNLIGITDYNKLQIDGFTRDIVDLEPLADKWRAFGWEVFEMDGHDADDCFDTLTRAAAAEGRPAMVLAHTVKAKGNLAVENRPESHNIKVPDQAAYDKFMSGLAVTAIELPY